MDAYVNNACLRDERRLLERLNGAASASEAAGLPPIAVSEAMGRHLSLLARACGARHVLEIGTLGGYSTIWLASVVGAGGRVVSLELDEHRAAVARANIARAGLADRVEVVVAPAIVTLDRMRSDVESSTGSSAEQAPVLFDFVFIDADKEHCREYLHAAVELTRPGGLIVVDNVIRDGRVLDEATDDQSVRGVRDMFDYVAGERRLASAAIQTVGSKGHDGYLLGIVQAVAIEE